MGSFANSMGITKISFFQDIRCYCPLGRSCCTYEVRVSMKPGKVIPDYVEVDKMLKGMDGSVMTIEDAVGSVYNAISNMCEPESLEVSIYCEDASHFPVTVTKGNQ